MKLLTLLSTLFTLKGGQFSLRINRTWNCMAHSAEDASVQKQKGLRAVFRMLAGIWRAEERKMSWVTEMHCSTQMYKQKSFGKRQTCWLMLLCLVTMGEVRKLEVPSLGKQKPLDFGQQCPGDRCQLLSVAPTFPAHWVGALFHLLFLQCRCLAGNVASI